MRAGIVGCFCCGLLAPFALFYGLKARAEIDAQPGRYTNRGHATAGIVMGAIGTVLMVLGLIARLAAPALTNQKHFSSDPSPASTTTP
jgi:hypothetical protein